MKQRSYRPYYNTLFHPILPRNNFPFDAVTRSCITSHCHGTNFSQTLLQQSLSHYIIMEQLSCRHCYNNLCHITLSWNNLPADIVTTISVTLHYHGITFLQTLLQQSLSPHIIMEQLSCRHCYNNLCHITLSWNNLPADIVTTISVTLHYHGITFLQTLL